MSPSRKISLAIAILYGGLSFYAGGLNSLIEICIFLPFPLACIWYAESMGAYSSPMHLSRPTPGIFVSVFGWILLLLPIIMFLMRKH